MRRCAIIISCLLSFAAIAQGPATPQVWETPEPAHYAFLQPQLNRLSASPALNIFYEKLYQVNKTHKGVVRIVHIGDSHLQADMITEILRNGFRGYFGNAGRGMSFPYQLAKSNGPRDISSASNTTWQYNRLAHPEIDIVNGLAGFGIHSTQANAEIRFNLRKGDDSTAETFDRVKFFLGADSNCYALTIPGSSFVYSAQSRPGIDTPSINCSLKEPASSFILSRCNEDDKTPFDFYGLSMEKDNSPGVIYHTIGVNGAQYEQYTNTPLFWQQLPALQADCYIVSLGTNEAQRLGLSADTFKAEIDAFIQKIKTVSPNAAIILTTPAGSYYRQKNPNKIIRIVSEAMADYCLQNKIACWDLYSVSSGVGGTVNWRKSKLLSHDLVHYSKEGYQLQGKLLLHAIAHGYNEFVAKRKEPVKEVIRKPKTGGK